MIRAIEHNNQREKVVDKVQESIKTWEYDTIGPQPFGSAVYFTAKKDIERHLPDNMIASLSFDLGEWLNPIKAGEECWRLETFGEPWYYCPNEQIVKEGCTQRFETIQNDTEFTNIWGLTCDNELD